MPEINEVRKYADFIKRKFKNKYITDIKILNGRYKKHGPFENYYLFKKSLPLKVLDVKTKGKFLYIIFQNEIYLFATLGLSGGWVYLRKNSQKYQHSDNLKDYSLHFTKKQIESYLNNALNHLNVEFTTNQGTLYFYDVLSYGTLKVVNGKKSLEDKLKKLGPDIMDTKTTLNIFSKQIKKTRNLKKPIGIVLMDQKTISGIGNYLRSDILYMSKINPFRKVKNLSEQEISNIFKNSKILTWGDYDKKTARKLKIITNKTILPETFNRIFFVYNHDFDMYNNKVTKKLLYEGKQKRFIYYVKNIQK